MIKKTLLFIFYAHVPYIYNEDGTEPFESSQFFEMLSYGFLPFLRMCARLEAENVPFKCALMISPILCEMLSDHLLQDRYIAFLDDHIAFAQKEFDRVAEPAQHPLHKLHLDLLTLNRNDFVNIHKKNILEKINGFVAKGYIEMLATSATPCFFPLYQDVPETLTAQIELGLNSFREHFSTVPSGFWLPAMGYNTGLDRTIKSYGIDYTVLESQSFLFADRPPTHGIFSPAMSEHGLAFLGKDRNACIEIMHPETGCYLHPNYLDTERDIGFELDERYLSSLFEVKKGRQATGICYYHRGSGERYDAAAGALQAEKDAERFIDNRLNVLSDIADILDTGHLCSACVLPFRFLGKIWFEGMHWLETVFRKLAQMPDMDCALPADYLHKVRRIQSINPFYSSNLPSGYADELINSSNDWMFPRIKKATERMIDLAGRFPNDQGFKERTLNMAAKEVLLAQSVDWPLMSNSNISAEYAAKRCEEHINSFTAAYEALGSGTISTNWLIKREKSYPIFLDMNYRFFIKRA